MFDAVAIGSATKDNYLISKFKLIDWPETLLKKARALFPQAACQILKDMYRRPRFLEIISDPIERA